MEFFRPRFFSFFLLTVDFHHAFVQGVLGAVHGRVVLHHHLHLQPQGRGLGVARREAQLVHIFNRLGARILRIWRIEPRLNSKKEERETNTAEKHYRLLLHRTHYAAMPPSLHIKLPFLISTIDTSVYKTQVPWGEEGWGLQAC